MQIGDERVVEKLRDAIDSLIDRQADDVELAEEAFARLEIEVDAHLRGLLRRWWAGNHAQFFDLCVNALAAHVDLRAIAVDRKDDAFEPQSAHRNPRPDCW